MRLRTIGEELRPLVRPREGAQPRPWHFYVDLDGVLVDLAAGCAGNRECRNWKDPEAIVEAVRRRGGDPADPEAVRAFYLALPKTREADALWAAVWATGPASVRILTSIPPARFRIADLGAAKEEWVIEHLQPAPYDVLVVPHRGKGDWARPDAVLIDDSAYNVDDWRERGGAGILHQQGTLRGTQSAIAHPDGQLGFEYDPGRDEEGIPTDLPRYGRGGGRDAAFARYVYGGAARRLSMRVARVPFADGSDEDVEIWGVYGAKDDAVKDLVAQFKQHGMGTPGVDDFLRTAAEVIATYVDRYDAEVRPTWICVPESSSPLAGRFAAAIAARTGIRNVSTWSRTRDPAQIKINPHGAAQYAAAKTAHAADPMRRQLNPARRELAGAARYAWSPEEVAQRWHAKVARWATGEVKTKDLDKFIRRGNMMNLFVPPADFPADLDGGAVLIVDDVSTFQTTIVDMARTLYDRGAAIAFGSVLWLF